MFDIATNCEQERASRIQDARRLLDDYIAALQDPDSSPYLVLGIKGRFSDIVKGLESGNQFQALFDLVSGYIDACDNPSSSSHDVLIRKQKLFEAAQETGVLASGAAQPFLS